MSSQLHSETARINGAKSQGPVTPEGRARSSQNALRHGLSSVQVVIPGEDPAEFEELRKSYLDLFQPSSRPERELADTMAAARWRLRRINRIETELLTRDLLDLDLAAAFDQMANESKTPALLIRYERHLTRTYEGARKELQTLQKMKAAQASAPQPEHQSERVQNEPKREAYPALKSPVAPQNEPKPTAPGTLLPPVAPDLLRETPRVGACTA
jgi:hypothetical protein